SGIVVHVEPAPDKYFCGEIKPGSRFTHRQAVTDNRPDDHEFKLHRNNDYFLQSGLLHRGTAMP
ncbi:hypothetical protein KPNIH18_27081, partial [Klebsiella pneumoniae subsp. pneumoniae KPNIH18]